MARTTYKIWISPTAPVDGMAKTFDTIAALFHVSLATNGNWNERTFVELNPDHETAFDIRSWVKEEGLESDILVIQPLPTFAWETV